MVNTATSNEQHQHEHQEQQQHLHLHQPEPLNDPSGILSNSPNFAVVNGIQIFEPIYQPNIAEKHLKVASVTLPNGHKRDFHIHKNSKGNVLFDLAAESETLLEKDYFGLRYEDELGEMTWLYPDKRIQKQLKHKPWNFVFQIKFYPPEPSALADDLTRYLLYLQVRKEIYEGKLPASYAKQILLAAMVMQAEIGDFEAIKQSPHDYEHFLREQHLIPQIDEEVLTKVREAHKEQKGLTPNEAHQKYLDTAKNLAKYGFTFFNAKDTKNGPVIIGVYAPGICVYKDQLQIHRFLWQGVNKIQFRGSKFSVVLKPGELDPKKEVTVTYRLTDYTTAKKLYRTAVEHHTFFRLIKPEDKPKGTFLRRWGSDRFRYQGRTYFQAKMASQMFDHPSQGVQRTPSGRQVSRSVDDLAQPRSFPTSPMHYVDETTQQLTSPEKSKSYSLSTSKADKAKKKAEELLPLSVVVNDLQQQQQQQQHQGFKRNSMSSSPSESSCSVSMASPNSGEYYVRSSYTPQEKSTVSPYEEVIFPLAISKEERQQQYQTPIQRSSANRNSRVRFSSDTKPPVTPDDGSAVAMAPANRPGKRKAKRRLFGPVNDDHTAFSPVDDLYKAAEISSVPLDSRVTLYDKGWYTTPSTSRALSPTGLFVGCCKPPRRTLVSERLLRNRQSLPSSSEYSIIKRQDIEPHPIRYFVEVYHSGRSQIDTRRKQKLLPRKDVDFVNPNELNKDYYNFPNEVCYDWDRTECSRDPEGLPLKQFSTIYWFGGSSKQGNAKPVGIKGQNIIISSDIREQEFRGESERKMIITESSLSKQAAREEEEPQVVEIVEEKPVITVRQEEGKTITTIETTTVITTQHEAFEGDLSQVIKEEVQASTVVTEPTVVETTPKAEEFDTVPIRKYSNVYHTGTSVKISSPMEWAKKKRAILFIKKSSSTQSQASTAALEQQPSTSKELTPESGEKVLLGKRKKSSEGEQVVAKIAHEVSERARTFSMSKHYPEITKPFEGELKEIQRIPEAPIANLFDCVSFADDENIADEPKSKKAKHSRAARFCLACVGGSQPREIERTSSKETEAHVPEAGYITERTHIEEVYAYEPTKVTDILKTVETVTKSETKKYDKIPEVIVTHDFSLIPATSEEELQQTLSLQSEVQHSDLSQHVDTIPAGTSYQIVEEETKTLESVTIPPTPTPSEATFVEEIVHQNLEKEKSPSESFAKSNNPFTITSLTEQIDILKKNNDVQDSELLNSRSSPVEVEQLYAEHPEDKTLVQEEAYKTHSGTESQNFEPATIHKESIPNIIISKRTKMLAEKNHYPIIGVSYNGEISELSRQEDFREANLFDTISFQSASDDSGLGVDSGENTTTKQRNQLWCVPKSNKSKERSTKATNINYTEIQAARNKKVKRARIFSFSKHYPEIGGILHDYEVIEMAPVSQAPFSNLFDEINFASDEFTKQQTKTPKQKPKSSAALWCLSKNRKPTLSILSTESNKSVKEGNILQEDNSDVIEKDQSYSLSQYYPEISAAYEGELNQIIPVKEVEFLNIFDAISFAPKQETLISHEQQKKKQQEELKHKSTGFSCIPKSKREKRTTSITSEESIKKGTLNKIQVARNKAVERARTFSMSKNYPEIGRDVYEGELMELSPSTQPQFSNLFDEIDFAPDEEVELKAAKQKTPKTKKEKSSNLLCIKKSQRKTSETSSVSSISLKDHKNLNAMQTARNKLVRRARYFSMSKNYPEIGAEPQEIELVEMAPIQQAPFTNLFDEISFAPDEEIQAQIDESQQKKQKKHRKQQNLLCTKKSKRKSSGISLSSSSGTSISTISIKDHKNLNAMQIARNKLVKRTRYFSISKHYPEITQSYEGELVQLSPVQQAPSAKLFDEISFASSEDVTGKEIGQLKISKKRRGLPNCLACTNFKSDPKEITIEADEFAYEKATVLREEAQEEAVATTHEKVLVEKVMEPVLEFDEHVFTAVKEHEEPLAPVVKEIIVGHGFSRELHEQTVTEESVEITLPLQNNTEASEYAETTIDIPLQTSTIEATLIEQEDVKTEVSPPFLIEEKATNEEGNLPPFEPHVSENSNVSYQQQVFEVSQTKDHQHDLVFESPNPNLLVIHHEEPQKSAATIQQEEEWLIGYPKAVEEQAMKYDDKIIHSEKALKSHTYPTTNDKNKEYVKTSKMKMFSLPWSKKKKLDGYPLYNEAFDKDVVELSRAPEAPEKNLFDTISFQSDSDDSGLGADSGLKLKKTGGLLCVSKSKKSKLKPSEVEKVNYTEVQAARNKKVKRARLFSFSKHYPEIGGDVHDNELIEISPVQQAPFSNLFDEINFAPDEKSETQNPATTAFAPKDKLESSSGLWCLPSGKTIKRTASVDSIKSETMITANRKYSMSTNYPEIGATFGGELLETKPAKEVAYTNIFDAINFVPKEEKLATIKEQQRQVVTKEGSKRKTKLWCVHGDSKHETSSVSSKSEESIQKGTLNALQVARNRIVQKARTFSMSENYPEQGTSFEGNLTEISPAVQAPSANLFDCVSFDDEPPAVVFTVESMATINKELPRERPNYLLACLSCGNVKFRSDHYPAITEPYGGELTNLQPRDEMQKKELDQFVSTPIKVVVSEETSIKTQVIENQQNSGYPAISESFTGQLNTLYPQQDVGIINLNEHVSFVDSSKQSGDQLKSDEIAATEYTERPDEPQKDIQPQELQIEKHVTQSSETKIEKYLQQPEVIITEVSDLTLNREIPNNEITEHITFSETGEGSYRRVSQIIAAQKHIIISDEAPEMISAITNIEEPSDIEYHELTPAVEMPSKNLFDTISFQSTSDDSGLGVDSGTKINKHSKIGLLCIPKSKTKAKPSEVEKVNYTEVQTARNKKVKRARFFSFSKNYPDIAQPYEGELVEIAPVRQASFTNLFDEINFAPDDFVKQETTTLVTKKKSKSGLWCMPSKKNRKASIPSIISEESIQKHGILHSDDAKAIMRERTYSMSQYYPEIGVTYEGELNQIAPNQEVEFLNIFDAINFAPKEEAKIFAEPHYQEPLIQKEPKQKSSGFSCIPKSKKEKRTTSITSEESIKKGTLNKIQVARNKAVERARTFSMSKNYPEIGREVYVGAVGEMAPVKEIPSANLFDEIDFEPEEAETVESYKKHQKRKPHARGIKFSWCGAKHYDYSDYPSDTKQYTGELKELKVVEEAPSANLFDCVSFASVDDVNQALLLNGHVVSQPTLFEHQQPIIIEQESVTVPYGYPLPTEIYEGEIDILEPQRDNDYINIYEQIEHVPKGISYIPPARKPSFLDKIRRASFRESNEHISYDRDIIREEAPLHVQKSQALEIPTIIEPQPVEVILEQTETKTSETHVESSSVENLQISESSEKVEELQEHTRETDVELINSGDITYHSEVTIIPDVFIMETVESETIQATVENSEHYPVITEPFTGVYSTLTKHEEAPTSLLFDEISFLIVNKDHDKQDATISKSQKTNRFLWCGPQTKQKSASPALTERAKTNKLKKRDRTFSMSLNYPEIAEPYEGDFIELTPSTQAPSGNLFDEIDFASAEITDATKQAKPKQSIWCIPKSKREKRTTSITSEESIKKGTLNKIQVARNKAVERARTFSMSKNYPEIGRDVYEGELMELSPSTQPQFSNLFDEIDFAPDEEVELKAAKQKTPKTKKEKSSNLLCIKKSQRKTSETSSVSSISLKDHKNLNAMQTARNKLVRRARYFSMSKNYPEIGAEPQEIELVEMAPIQQAPFTNLFDEISFAPDEEIQAQIDESQQKKQKKHRKQQNLLCTKKSKRKSSGISLSSSSGTSISTISIKDHKNLNAMQIARNKLVKRTRYFSISKHYPEITQSYEGELVQLSPVQQAPSAKLFDEISFASDVEENVIEFKESKERQPLRNLVGCLTCAGHKSQKALEEPYEGESIGTSKFLDVPSSTAFENASTVVVVEEDLALQQSPEPIVYSNYPDISEPYTGEVSTLYLTPEVESANIPYKQAVEHIELVIQRESDNNPTAEIILSEDKEWISGEPEEIKTEHRQQTITTHHVTSETSTHHYEQEEKPKTVISSFEQVLSDYPQLAGAYETDINQLTKVSEVPDYESYEETTTEPTKVSAEEVFGEHATLDIIEQKSRNISPEAKVETMQQASKRTKMLAEKKHYPLIGTSYSGEVSELPRQKDFHETNLFDTISFQSTSDDSGLGVDSGTKINKHSKIGLLCIPKSKTKAKPSEVEKVNYTEVQTARNKKVKRARFFSFSKNYPDIAQPYEGELVEIAPVRQASFTNLFDEINFAPDDFVKQETTTLVTKKKSKSGLWCMPSKKNRKASIPSIISEESIQKHGILHSDDAKAIMRERTYSMSQYYPEIGVTYEGELNQIAPNQEVEFLNIFDAINFAPKEEAKIFAEPHYQEPLIQKEPKQKSSGFSCIPKSKKEKRTTSITSEESIKKGTLNKIQVARNKAVERARTFSMSKNYPEIGRDVYEGELMELSPSTHPQFSNLFDEIDFAPDEETVVAKPKEITKSFKPRSNKMVLCVPFQSSSKHYPALEEPYSGPLYETAATKEASSADLFKCVDFASSDEQNELEDKVVRMQSEERQPRKQMATLYFRRNTKQLEGYPIISEAYKGEIVELLRHPEVETINLFDCVSFASASDDEVPISQSSNARDSSSKKGSPDKPKKKQLRLFGKTRRSTSDKELDLSSYPKIEAHSGPVEEIIKNDELEQNNLRKNVTLYHSGYSQSLFRHRFIREKHDGVEEIGETPADYEILNFTAEDTTPLSMMSELETLPLRAYAKYPIVSISESPRDIKRKFSKSKIIPESSSESSSQSESETDTVPSLKPPKKKENEGFLSFFKNRLSSKQHRKRTGYEGLVDAFSGSYDTTQKSNEMPDQPILEHVHVYHNGNSSQQPIDSGFEDGANASETERTGTFKRTGKLFFDKFKLSRDSGDKTTTEEIDKSESLEPKKGIIRYENLNIEPFLGLHSSTFYVDDIENLPLTSTIDTLPTTYYYEGDVTLTPTQNETFEGGKISTLERFMKSTKPRKDSNSAYEFLSVEGPVDETGKKGEINDLPIGEHVTVYHCGRSDVPTAEIPPEVYVYEKEPISESLQSLKAPTDEHQIILVEQITNVQKTKRESLKRYPESFTYEGPIESLDRLPEVKNQHLKEYVNIYHSGFSTDIPKKTVAKAVSEEKHESERQNRYSFDTTPYEGEIEKTSTQKELAHLPLSEHALNYHPGKSEVEILEDLEEREIQIRELSLIQRLMAMFKKRELQGYPSSSEEYTGPLEEIHRSEDVEKNELKNIANVYHSGYSYDPKTSKLTIRRFAPRKRLRINMNDYPKDSAPMDAVIYDLQATEDIPKTPSPVTLPPESLIFQGPPKQKEPSRWYRFWFLRRRGQSSPKSSEFDTSMPIAIEAMSHRITDTSSSLIMATTDRSLFSKGHWPVTDIDVDVVLKTVTKCQCECEALIIEKTFETGIGGSVPLQHHHHHQQTSTTLNDTTSFRMDNNCIMQTSNGTWLAKVTKRISTQMDRNEKAELFVVEGKNEEEKNELNDEVLQQPSVVKEEKVEEVEGEKEEEEEIEVPRNSTFSSWNCEPSYLWSTETYKNLEELIDDEELKNIISTESGDLPLTHENKELKNSSSVRDSEMFASIRRRLSEKLAKKEKKKEEKRLKKEEKERKKHAGKSGGASATAAGAASHGASTGGYASESSSSSASVSDAEIEERHVVISKAIEGPVQTLNRGRELGDLGNIEEDIDNNNKKLVKMAPQTSMGASAVNNIEANSSGPYTPAKEKDGRIIREETVEQVYRISGTGHAPNLDPNDMSLQSTVDRCIRDTERMPRVQMVEANVLVKECEPLPHGISEGSAPHTTLHSWHETEDGPETITTEVDEHGNKITRTVKTQTTKHTIQKQTYQTYAVEDKDKPDQTIIQTKESSIPLGNKSVTRSPVVHTKTRTVAYEKGSEPHENIDPIGELVSTKTITTGNRTVEILTYKTEKDGVIETRVEHRVTIHSGENIDHDAELAKALLEATEMSPDLIINRVEVEKQTQR